MRRCGLFEIIDVLMMLAGAGLFFCSCVNVDVWGERTGYSLMFASVLLMLLGWLCLRERMSTD